MVMERVHADNRKFTVRPENGEAPVPPVLWIWTAHRGQILSGRYFSRGNLGRPRERLISSWMARTTYPYVPNIVSVILV